ncbi:MAG: hypothetical protein NT040_00390 [Bacteroidetes bacterium]|nr:hypothetical protein [Bacteroidota bacterium]
MEESRVIYALFNIIGGESVFWSLLKMIVSVSLGGCIVYFFNIRLEIKRNKHKLEEDFENRKQQICQTIDEYRLIYSYIADYQTMSEFQRLVKDKTGYFNENIYNIRVAKFDDFRMKFAELKSKLLGELARIDNKLPCKGLLKEHIDRIEKYDKPYFFNDGELNVLDDSGEVIKEPELYGIIQRKLHEPGQLYSLVLQLKETILLLTLQG